MDILITILLGTVKFGMTFPLAIMEFRFGFFETVLWINVGGVAGIYFFAYLSDGLNRWLEKKIRQYRKTRNNSFRKKNEKKVFTKRNRRIIRIRQRFGLIGIAASAPILLSIPVGVFLVVRYYSNVRGRFLWLIAGNIIWSFIYTSFYMFWDEMLFSR